MSCSKNSTLSWLSLALLRNDFIWLFLWYVQNHATISVLAVSRGIIRIMEKLVLICMKNHILLSIRENHIGTCILLVSLIWLCLYSDVCWQPLHPLELCSRSLVLIFLLITPALLQKEQNWTSQIKVEPFQPTPWGTLLRASNQHPGNASCTV